MSGSPGDVRPVLDAVAERAARLCQAPLARVLLVDGDALRAMAEYSLDGTSQARTVPLPLRRTTIVGRAFLDRVTIHHADVVPLLENEYPDALNAQRLGLRAVLAVPLMREGNAYGVILLWRREPGLFSPDQVALLQTFAQQAAIAVDNVRLFKATKEALERQTATSEILRVMSSSPTDVQPVFDTIVANAARICSAESAAVYRFDDEIVHFAAGYHFSPEALEAYRRRFPCPLRETDHLRRVLDGSVLNIPDIDKDPHTTSGSGDVHRARGVHGTALLPMVRGGQTIGAIGVSHRDIGAFSNERVELLKTFAAQAVIAIENVQLFNETKEALERQTATSEILRVISSFPGDVKPMLDAVAERALKLCDAAQATIVLVDGGALRCAAAFGETRTLQEGELMPLTPGSVAGRAIHDGAPFQIEDLATASEDEFPVGRELQRRIGHHTALAVPLMREDRAIGAIQLWRMEIRAFSEKQVALVKTFADQAAIAIENVRLFKELEARTKELTRSVGELKALGEIGQAVSSTLDLETVLSTIVARAAQLAGMDGGSIWEYDEAREEFHLHATDRFPNELVEMLRSTRIRKGEGALGRLAVTGEPVEIREIANEQSYGTPLREILIRSGYRSVLVVPLLREEHLLGALGVNRTKPGEFSPRVIALLKTFATQSALAIQNARLFREIQDKSAQLELASQHKSEFLANMSHELRTPLNAIIGFSEVLSERMFGEINEKQAEYIGDILQSGQHLLSLINDILDLSKIEAGRMELELCDFDLPGAIENTLTLVRERAVRRGIALERSVDVRLGTIRADQRKLKQVLLNLLSNALKFTPEGGKIDVRAAVIDGVAEISVTDTGVGIAPEEQEAVFEEFRQVGTAAKKVEGTGLGLAISRKFIELHGGRIWVKSQIGSGSTFAFTLPLPSS
jgi:signal transduction histidine kinase